MFRARKPPAYKAARGVGRENDQTKLRYPHKLRWWKNTLPLTLGFLEEARASSQKLRKRLSDGSHYRLELRRCEVAQTQVLPVIGAVVRYARDGYKQKIER